MMSSYEKLKNKYEATNINYIRLSQFLSGFQMCYYKKTHNLEYKEDLEKLRKFIKFIKDEDFNNSLVCYELLNILEKE